MRPGDSAAKTKDIGRKRTAMTRSLVRYFLHVPKPLRVPESEAWTCFMSISQEWKLGQTIYKDQVLFVKAGRSLFGLYQGRRGRQEETT